MKLIIVALALVAMAAALPVDVEPIPIVRSVYEQKSGGGYDFDFESGNGIVRSETGEVKEVLDEEKKPHVVIVVRGTYSYPGDDGKPETINYFADETGYHAEGPSIPVAASRR